MELTVFGATGRTGRQVVQQALDAGHRVTAVVRDPARLAISHAALSVVTADVTDPRSVAPAVAGRTAAISALGPSSRKQTGIGAAGARAILRAMDQTGVRRFIAVSAVPVGPLPEGESWPTRVILTPLLRAVLRDWYADLAEMEQEIMASATEWTIVRPPRLTNKPRTGVYRTLAGGNVPHGRLLSRADLAHAMLAMLGDAATIKRVVGVAY